MFSDVCEANNRLIKRHDRTLPGFLSQFFLHWLMIAHNMALDQMAQGFWVGPRKPCITGIKWHFLMKHLKANMKLRQFPWITQFFTFCNYSSLFGVKSQLTWAKRPNAARKRVKALQQIWVTLLLKVQASLKWWQVLPKILKSLMLSNKKFLRVETNYFLHNILQNLNFHKNVL